MGKFKENIKKILMNKMKFQKQLINTTQNQFQRDLEQVKTLQFKVKFLNKQ